MAPAVLLAAAILIEQSPTVPRIPITQNLPLFHGLGGHLEGADILLLMVLCIYLIKARRSGAPAFPRTHVSFAVAALFISVLVAVVVGHIHGGRSRMALMQARPYVYLAATYFLTSALVRDRKAIRWMLWAFVLSVGFKALQGIYMWARYRHTSPTPDSYIGHEASYFFVIFIILVLTLWLFEYGGALRRWATWLLPLVVFAAIVNDRRAAWEMLGGALLCFVVIAYSAIPFRRHILAKSIVAVLLLSAVYFPVMWNSTNSFGGAARAVKSHFTPSARDASSDIYRVQENANLELNVKQTAPVGTGFGVKIDYALPITDISQIDPDIAYIPHDGVLDVLVNMGFLGGVATWFLIGAGIIAGSRMARLRDRHAAVVGTVMACSLVAYALMGALDQGFFFYRIAFITGCLLGVAEAARRLARTQPDTAFASRFTLGH